MNIRYDVADLDLLYRDNMLLIQLMPVFIMIAVVGTLGVIANILLNAENAQKQWRYSVCAAVRPAL